ncbi:MAG TPA: Lrp/AsnC family transcriptional regulator, partial [Dongiaceae bacterium]|nr:Lrp/AsnC family transcriptional regulator [Dongiaceae bacterium]
MDLIDRKILDCVQRDGALTYAEIGAAAGLSASTVNDRLKRLRADGALRRMTAEIDPAAVDLKLLAFVMVVVQADVSEDQFRAGMLAAPEVLECHHITGEFSYLLKLRLRDTAQLEAFLANRLKPLAGFGRTQTLIALSSTKETHVLPALNSQIG